MCLVAYLTKRPYLSEIFFWPKFLLVYSLQFMLQRAISTAVFPQEIAKRMHEEEEQRLRRRSRGQEGHSEGTV